MQEHINWPITLAIFKSGNDEKITSMLMRENFTQEEENLIKIVYT